MHYLSQWIANGKIFSHSQGVKSNSGFQVKLRVAWNGVESGFTARDLKIINPPNRKEI